MASTAYSLSLIFCPKTGTLIVHAGYACKGFIHLGFFLLDSGLSTDCFLTSLIKRKAKEKARCASWQPQTMRGACSLHLVSTGPLSPRLLPHKWAYPHPKSLSTFRVTDLKLGSSYWFNFFTLFKLSSQNKRRKYELNIRIDLGLSLKCRVT